MKPVSWNAAFGHFSAYEIFNFMFKHFSFGQRLDSFKRLFPHRFQQWPATSTELFLQNEITGGCTELGGMVSHFKCSPIWQNFRRIFSEFCFLFCSLACSLHIVCKYSLSELHNNWAWNICFFIHWRWTFVYLVGDSNLYAAALLFSPLKLIVSERMKR